MNEPRNIAPDQRTELVAYLDGELDEAATQKMERLLADSPDARYEVDMLSRTFSLLDTLPRPNASAEFSAKTLTNIRAAKTPLRWSEQAWYRHARRGAVLACWVVGLTLAGMTSYYAANRLHPEEDAQLIRDLPVIENLDAYSDVSGIEDVKALEKHGDFNEENDANDGNQE